MDAPVLGQAQVAVPQTRIVRGIGWSTAIPLGVLGAIIATTAVREFATGASPILTYADELILLFGAFGIVLLRRGRVSLPYGSLVALLAFAGLIVASIWVNAVPLRLALAGSILLLKPVIVFAAFYQCGAISARPQRMQRALESFLLWVVGLSLLAAALEIVLGHPLIPSDFSEAPRFGYTPVRAIFVHPGVLGSMMLLAACFFLAEMTTGRRRMRHLLGFIGAIVCVLLAARAKALLVLPLALAVSWAVSIRANHGRWPRVRPGVMIGAGAVTGAFTFAFWPIISIYTGERGATSVRNLLLSTAVKINRDYGLLGAGPGMFGSAVSYRMHYSPLYYEYGLAGIYGASPEFPLFLGDQWWAWFLGEVGVLGMAAFLLFLYQAIRWMMPPEPIAWGSIIGCAAGALSYGIITGFADANLTTPPFGYAAMGLLGWSCGAVQRRQV